MFLSKESSKMTESKVIRGRIAKLVDVLIQNGVATEDTIVGCSAQEISQMEAEVGPLPTSYREFLLKMGRGAGNFYVGTDLFYPDFLGITEAAHHLVAEDKADIILPKDTIVFMMHQGYQFMFVRSGEGADPPVYYYMEQSGQFTKKADHLTQFLIDVAKDEW